MSGLPHRRALPFVLFALSLPLLGEVGPCVPIEPVCPAGERVDPATGQCEPGCAETADCPDGRLCRRVECEAPGTECPWQCLPPDAECWSALDCERNDPCDDAGGCDDGWPYSEWECRSFRCYRAPILDCDDENPCTEDMMDPVTGCRNVAVDGLLCDDLDRCSVSDVCAAGLCEGRPTETCAGLADDQCFDAVDNDGDGFTDATDPDCATVPCCPEG